MSHIIFSRATGRLILPGGAIFVAANFVDSASGGPFPQGEFSFLLHNPHPNTAWDPDSPFGTQGIFIFNVPHRTDMGIHAGRASVPDGLRRTGPFHCTEGCIRTTEPAMLELCAQHAREPVTSLVVA